MPNIRSSHDMALCTYNTEGVSAYGLDKDLAKYRVVASSNTANKIKAVRDVEVYIKVEKIVFFV